MESGCNFNPAQFDPEPHPICVIFQRCRCRSHLLASKKWIFYRFNRSWTDWLQDDHHFVDKARPEWQQIGPDVKQETNKKKSKQSKESKAKQVGYKKKLLNNKEEEEDGNNNNCKKKRKKLAKERRDRWRLIERKQQKEKK